MGCNIIPLITTSFNKFPAAAETQTMDAGLSVSRFLSFLSSSWCVAFLVAFALVYDKLWSLVRLHERVSSSSSVHTVSFLHAFRDLQRLRAEVPRCVRWSPARNVPLALLLGSSKTRLLRCSSSRVIAVSLQRGFVKSGECQQLVVLLLQERAWLLTELSGFILSPCLYKLS